MKCVMVIDHTLPLGLIANTAAVLAMSVSNRFEELIGEDVLDGDQTPHPGITRLPVMILRGDGECIRSLRQRLLQRDTADLFFVDFCDVAQQSKHYDDYRSRMEATPAGDLQYLGLAIYGPERQVNSLTGGIGLLR